jgi:hypothetical protein
VVWPLSRHNFRKVVPRLLIRTLCKRELAKGPNERGHTGDAQIALQRKPFCEPHLRCRIVPVPQRRLAQAVQQIAHAHGVT